MEDETKCCMCGVDSQLEDLQSRQRVLYTNAPVKIRCGHRFCSLCVERNLRRQSQFACPKCGTVVRRATLDERTTVQIEVDRDASSRKRVLAVHNRRKETFPTKEDYDAYLEMVEDLIYDLSRGGPEAKKVEETLASFHAQNANAVAKNASVKIESDRSKFLKVRETTYVQELAAQRARDKDRQWKLKKEEHTKHQRAFQLGDRDDAPPPLMDESKDSKAKEKAFGNTGFILPPLPALQKIQKGPDMVNGDELQRRRLTTGYDPFQVAKQRSIFDFLTAFDAWQKPQRMAFGMPDLKPYTPTVRLLLQGATTTPPKDELSKRGNNVVPMSDD